MSLLKSMSWNAPIKRKYGEIMWALERGNISLMAIVMWAFRQCENEEEAWTCECAGRHILISDRGRRGENNERNIWNNREEGEILGPWNNEVAKSEKWEAKRSIICWAKAFFIEANWEALSRNYELALESVAKMKHQAFFSAIVKSQQW